MERIRRKEAFELLKSYPSKSMYEGVRDKDETLEDIIAKVDKKDINCSAKVTKMTDMFLRFSDGRYTVFKGEYFKFYYTEGNYVVIEEILPTAEKYVYVYYLDRHERPTGTFAKNQVYEMKVKCHDLFDKKWNTSSQRKILYTKLAKELSIPVEECHFGYFDMNMLNKAYNILSSWRD